MAWKASELLVAGILVAAIVWWRLPAEPTTQSAAVNTPTASAGPRIGNTPMRITADQGAAIACRTTSYFDRRDEFAFQGDRAAALKLGNAALKSGICRMLQRHEIFLVVDTEWTTDRFKVRLVGELEELWLSGAMLEPAPRSDRNRDS